MKKVEILLMNDEEKETLQIAMNLLEKMTNELQEHDAQKKPMPDYTQECFDAYGALWDLLAEYDRYVSDLTIRPN